LDYFVEQPGRYTMAQAFFANQHALIHRLAMYHPEGVRMQVKPGDRPTGIKLTPQAKAAGLRTQDIAGLIHDRDVVALYGDPAWEARMTPGECAYDQTLTVQDGTYTMEIIPRRGSRSFAPVNTNGSERGYRPIVVFLPHRVKDVTIVEGQELRPVVTHSFVLVPNPKTCQEGKNYRVVFQAERVK
jgi:zinc protease